jgi:hypothetical protein
MKPHQLLLESKSRKKNFIFLYDYFRTFGFSEKIPNLTECIISRLVNDLPKLLKFDEV